MPIWHLDKYLPPDQLMHIWYNFYIRNLKLHSKARLSNPKLKFAWASWSNVEWYVIQVSDGGSLIIYIDNDVDIATDVNDDNDFSGKPSNDDALDDKRSTITEPRAMNTSKIYFDVFRCTISSSSLFA